MTKGDLSSLRWTSAENRVKNDPEYEVAFAALNFRDVMLASGRLPAEAIPGEYFLASFLKPRNLSDFKLNRYYLTYLISKIMAVDKAPTFHAG